MVRTLEGLKGRLIETGRNFEVRGPLIGGKVELNRNADAEDIYAQELIMEDGSRARNVYAERLRIEDNCQISGVIEYTESVEVGRGLVAKSGGPRKVDQLPKFPL
jgi:cytoskeletal protein CcmA (bactofilin family)